MIHLSRAAINEINRLKGRVSNPDLFCRLGVKPGGCSTLHYTLEFSDKIQPGDHVLECDGVQVAIDQDSLVYLEGLALDYSEDLMGGAFRFHNPNAAQSCDCGNSFSTSELPKHIDSFN